MLTLAPLRSDVWTASPELVDDFIGIRSLRQLTEGVQDGHLLTLVSAPATVRCEFHS